MAFTAIHPTVTPGRSSPLGATIVTGGVNFSVFSRNAAAIELLLFDREDDARPSRVIPLDPGDQPKLSLLARFRPGHSARPALWLPGARAVRPRQRHALRCEQGPARPLWTRRGCPSELFPRGRPPPGRQLRHGHEKRGGGSFHLRLGRRHAAETTIFKDHHLRDARPRLHSASELRPQGEPARNLCRPDREDSLFEATRGDGGRVAAGLSVRSPGLSAGQG